MKKFKSKKASCLITSTALIMGMVNVIPMTNYQSVIAQTVMNSTVINSSTQIGIINKNNVTASAIESSKPIGYGVNTTGGIGGTSVVCTTGADIMKQITAKKGNTNPLTIYVKGKITPANSGVDEILLKDLSNISIIGDGTADLDQIGIRFVRCNNIIVQNLKIHHVKAGSGEGDCLSFESTKNVWVDHCELYNDYSGNSADKDYYDGLLDFKKECENITVSYNYLHDSWKTMLMGFSDSDNYNRTITIHHNIFENCNSRLPLFRYGKAHIYNNYFKDIYTSCINSRMGAEVFVENNVFENVKNPVCSLDSDVIGYWNLGANVYNNCSGSPVSSAGEQGWTEDMKSTTSYKPTYSYSSESTTNLISTLKSSVGVGGGVTIGTSTTPQVTTTSSPVTTTGNQGTAVLSGENKHNFTTDGTSSSYFVINGSVASDKGDMSYNNLTLSKCIKIDSTGSISFTTSVPAKVTMVIKGKADGGELLLNGSKINELSSISTVGKTVTFDLSTAGKYTINKGSGENYIYYIAVSSSGGTVVTSNPSVTTTVTTNVNTTTSKPITTQSPINIGDYKATHVIFCSPNASSNGAGTLDSPTTVEKAIESIEAGGVVYLLAGTYKYNVPIKILKANSGVNGKIKMLRPYNGEVIFDFSGQTYGDTATNYRGFSLEGDYWHVFNITIKGAADNGMILSGSNNVVELCKFEANRDTGLQLSRTDTTQNNISSWPSYNLIKNCTSFNNMDPATGENADGFAPKLTCGVGNVFDGCIAYNNVDDGWDMYAKSETGPIGVVTLKNCISFRNGSTSAGVFTANSDGNGFKLGGSGIGTPHIVENCIAFENKKHGVTNNNNPEKLTLKDITSFDNGKGDSNGANFQLNRTNATFKNFLSYKKSGSASDSLIGTISNSIYYNSGKYYLVLSDTAINKDKVGVVDIGPSDADFTGIKSPALGADVHELWRNADGSINTQGFLMTTSNSKFNSMGAKFGASTASKPLEPNISGAKVGVSGSVVIETTTTAVTTATTTFTTTTTPNSTFKYGDLNSNSRVDNSDLVSLSQHLIGDKVLSGVQLSAADLTVDGEVDIADLALLKQYLMGDNVKLGN